MKNLYFKKMTDIYARLQDEESKKLFEARISYALKDDQTAYMESIGALYDDWNLQEELEEKMKDKPDGIIIFGCGHAGKMIDRMLVYHNLNVDAYCDNYKSGQMFEGKPVISVVEVATKYKKHLVIISSYEYGLEMKRQLMENGFLEEQILLSASKILVWDRGKQYFDIFLPQKDEIFVDAGSFDGGTISDFVRWTDNNYKKVFAFEPMKEACVKLRNLLEEKNIHNVCITEGAVWNEKQTLYFEADSAGSSASENGQIQVQGVSIDEVVGEEKITYLKMDVEGSELKALEGAKDTIIKHRPRLAICIYHKPLDVIEIPTYILNLVPEYKFYIRHYTSHMWETVLYAEV